MNRLSLVSAQRCYAQTGASAPALAQRARPPFAFEQRDPWWTMVSTDRATATAAKSEARQWLRFRNQRTFDIDEGELRGGFPVAFEVRLKGTQSSPLLRAVESSVAERRRFDSSMWLEISRNDRLVANIRLAEYFESSRRYAMFTTPDPYVIGVALDDRCYAYDLAYPKEFWQLPLGPLRCIASDHTVGRQFLADDRHVLAFDGRRVLWTSPGFESGQIVKLYVGAERLTGTLCGSAREQATFWIDADSGSMEAREVGCQVRPEGSSRGANPKRVKLAERPFDVIDWSGVEQTRHPGERGFALWRTTHLGDVRIRIVEYSAGYLADHWCPKGHVLHVLEGELDTELSDGTRHRLVAGMSYKVGDDAGTHRSATDAGAKLLIVD